MYKDVFPQAIVLFKHQRSCTTH